MTEDAEDFDKFEAHFLEFLTDLDETLDREFGKYYDWSFV